MKKYSLILITSLLFFGCGSENSTSTSSSESGIAGSKAKFTIAGDYLYTINGQDMNIFNILDASEPEKVSSVHLPFDVETIFPYNEYLYIGAESGMYIYDITLPTQPTKITTFTHAQSCDPVVIQDDIAYVTLNSNRYCSWSDNNVNRLEIIDVKDPLNPKLLKTVDMWEPGGLAIDENKLFICDGDHGLKIFDVNKSDNNTATTIDITSLGYDSNLNCYDLIAHENNLVVSNKDSIKQYNYTTLPLQEMGTIK